MAQRKIVTVLFCDVAGSTALGESLDAETLHNLLARYFARMKAIVERHGGIVEKFIGDAVMAVFGLPVVHEDDAVRALRAAAEMQLALPELGIEGRIGVRSGEVVTGTEERLATGDPVNVAARLQQAAQPGETLLGETTLRLARDAIEVAPAAPLSLKGKRAPVRAWRLCGRGDRRRGPTLRLAAGRARAGVGGDRGRVGAGPPWAGLRAGHGRRSRRRRKVAARGGVLGHHRRDGRARPLPLVRGGHHVLAGRGGPEAARSPAVATRARSRCRGHA